MIRAEIIRTEVPSGTPYREWVNITGDVLLLELPGLASLCLRPMAGCRSRAVIWRWWILNRGSKVSN
jgi:hypothetical protein